MSRTFSFHPEARRELRESVRYYEEEAPGLGADFAAVETDGNHILIVAVMHQRRKPWYWHERQQG